jgi:hypothetical protein
MSTVATFTVTLNTAAVAACSVDYTTVAETAASGTDYTLTSGTLNFAVGEFSKTIVVPVLASTTASVAKAFRCVLSNPVGCTLSGVSSGECVISTSTGGGTTTIGAYLAHFNWIYNSIKVTNKIQYFGPQSGAQANQMPYHAVEKLIAEAPDWGHESVSETISYWAKLEAWEIGLNGVSTGYAAMWASIEANYIPSAAMQPWGAYTAASPATYTPDGSDMSVYPTLANSAVASGADPLATPLQTQYGTLAIYGMHWLYDVDGVFGFHNSDGSTISVAVNNYGRGRHEGLFDTVMHVGWEDWTQGGNADGGFLPIYQQGLPTYPAAAFPYAKQFSFTTAPDAEVRTVESAWLAHKFAATKGLDVSAQDAKAKKMGDYMRYCTYDKYFKGIPGYDGGGLHNLISWYSAFGGQIPSGGPSNFGFRIGSSASHFGYNGVVAAYAMGTTGGYSPLTSGAAAQWQNSVSRQLEMIRWLQSPEGPIAGGVTNSWLGTYATPTDGRQTAKFYGLYYDYSPVYAEPPSNYWPGYQGWGLERVAALMLATATKTDTFSVNIFNNCKCILDKFVPWVLAHCSVTGGVITMPTNLSWVSSTQIVGQTTNVLNLDGSWEYLPSLNWDSSGNYATFWSGSGSVPNPNLHCTISSTGFSLGIAASFSQLLIEYAQAHRTSTGGALSDTIPNSSHTYNDAYALAKSMMDAIWGLADTIGFTAPETRGDYSSYGKTTYIPPGFTGAMHNGDVLAHGTTTFINARSFMKTDPRWADVAAFIAGGAAPVFNYHRFWEQVECASGFAMLHQYFPDLVYP